MTVGTGIPAARYTRATHLKKAIDRSPVNPSPLEAGVFACGLGQWPIGPRTSLCDFHCCDAARSAIGRTRVQWLPRERERLPPRLLAAAFRFVGRTGRGKNVPSGNSKYRLNTCT
jgi:hypothetical protein